MDSTPKRRWLLYVGLIGVSLAVGVAIGVRRAGPPVSSIVGARPVSIHALLKCKESAPLKGGGRIHVVQVTYEVSAPPLPMKLVWPPVGVFGYRQCPIQAHGEGSRYWKETPAVIALKAREVRRFEADLIVHGDPTRSPYFQEFVFGNPGNLPDKDIAVGSVFATCEWAEAPDG